MIETVGVVGLGLIGGSIAKAIRAYTDCTLYGYDADGAVLSRAMEEGTLSGVLTPEGLNTCDLVVVALYPEATVDYVTRNQDQFRKGGLVMDTGGVKSVVCTPLEAVARESGFHFIGGHPMAGIERSGYANAVPELFQGASLILTPYDHTPESCVSEIWSLMRQLGFGHLQIATPAQHDHIIAYTSQLAHVVSCAYVGSPSAPNFQGFSAGSFQDMTRVARLNETMWTELFLENRDYLAQEIDSLAQRLAEYGRAVGQGDREALYSLLQQAHQRKEFVDEQKEKAMR